MQEVRTPSQEAAEDIFFGQLVIIVARWFLIVAAAILILWNAASAAELILGIAPVILLIAMNFYLHGRYIVERPANQALIMLASLLDLVAITALVLIYDPAGIGFESQLFVLYYPVLLAFAFVFPRGATLFYMLVTLAAYTLATWVRDPLLVADSARLEILVQRLTTLAAVGLLGTYYWRIQRDRRRAAAGSAAMPDLSERRR